MNLGNIPGMYWDEEKKKYFAVQKNHKATSKDAKYTQENITKVKKQKKEDERARKRQKIEDVQLIKRNNVLRSSLHYRSQLGQELGHGAGSPVDIWTSAFASGLSARQCALLEQDTPVFAYDPCSRSLIHTQTDSADLAGHTGRIVAKPLRKVGSKSATRLVSPSHPLRACEFRPGRLEADTLWHSPGIRKLALIPSSNNQPSWLAMTSGLYSEHWLTLGRLGTMRRQISPGQYEDFPEIDVVQQFGSKRSERMEALSLQANPFSAGGEHRVAVGTNHGLAVFNTACNHHWTYRRPFRQSQWNISSVDWLDHDVVIASDNGINVQLIDLRTPDTRYSINHGHNVAKSMRGLNSFEVIVCGWPYEKTYHLPQYPKSQLTDHLPGFMRTYDTRMISNAQDAECFEASRAMFQWRDYKCPWNHPFAADVLREAGVIALSAGTHIRFHSMRDGTLLRSLQLGDNAKKDRFRSDRIHCIQAVTEPTGDMSFLVNCGRKVFQCTW